MFDERSPTAAARVYLIPMLLAIPDEARAYLRAWVVKFVKKNGELMTEQARRPRAAQGHAFHE